MVIEKKLQDLNNNPDLNKDNVVEMMVEIAWKSKFRIEDKYATSMEKLLNMNYRHYDIACGLSSFDGNLLHMAARFNCDRIASFLIERGAEIDPRNGPTPLHYAAICGGVKVAKVLIAEGADVNAQEYLEQTPLHYAVQYSDNIEVAKILIEKGASVNAQDRFGIRPLHYAAMYGDDIEAVKVLIAEGANVNAQNRFGIRPLYCALENNHLRTAKFLRDNNADPSCICIINKGQAEHTFFVTFLFTAVIGTIVTLGFLGFTTPLSNMSVTGAMLAFGFAVLASTAGAALIGGVAYGVRYMWSKHELSSQLDKVNCDAVSPVQQPAM